MRALIAGATGLVGQELLQQLLADVGCSQVIAIVRRGLEPHPKLNCIVNDMTALDQVSVPEATDAFCALGTTMRQAGSKEAFDRVDLHLVTAFAKLARAAGCQRFMLVSALSANPRSPIHYDRTKWKAEQAVSGLGFRSVHIVRPSVLLGNRTEARLGEGAAVKVMSVMAPLMVGPLRRYRLSPVEQVARVLIGAARSGATGTVIHRVEP